MVMLLSEEANTQGAMDVGLLPGYYPGYRKIDADMSEYMQELWTAQPTAKPGLSGWDMIKSAGEDISALWIMGRDLVRDLLYGNEIASALGKLDFLVVQDYFLTKTAQMADVVLPSCTFAETKGTFTNTDRRIQRINPAIRRLKDSNSDTDIILKAALHSGDNSFNFGRIEAIFEEISRVVPQYEGITYDSVGPMGRQWEVRI